jgi:lipid II:glycine glycyltransferase (peptidoglycan interpeptide bridge formation enzyme)
MHWTILLDSLEFGSDVYDMRGVHETLDEHDPLVGMLRFKLGIGGDVVETLGEWDLPLSRTAYLAFETYLRALDLRGAIRSARLRERHPAQG